MAAHTRVFDVADRHAVRNWAGAVDAGHGHADIVIHGTMAFIARNARGGDPATSSEDRAQRFEKLAPTTPESAAASRDDGR